MSLRGADVIMTS